MMLGAIPGRLLATVVFRQNGGPWGTVAVFEGLMGLFTALVLGWEAYNDRLSKKLAKD